MLLCRGVIPPPNQCPGYDIKQFDDEVPVMLWFWEMWSTPSLPSLPGPLWPGMVPPDMVLSMGQIELNRTLMLNWIVWNRNVFWHWNCILMLNWIAWNRTVYMYKVKLATVVEGDQKAPFSIAITPRCRGGRYFFPWIAPFYPWDWTQIASYQRFLKCYLIPPCLTLSIIRYVSTLFTLCL